MEDSGGSSSSNGGAAAISWTESVEDLMLSGEIDKSISILECVVSRLEKEIEGTESRDASGIASSSLANQLATALHDLYKLYSSKGLSFRADQTLSRALQIKQQISVEGAGANKDSEPSSNEMVSSNGIPEDDWEAIADRAPEELLAPQCLPGISKLSLEDSKVVGAKRRGRGTFSYKKQGMYSDNQCDEAVINDSENNSSSHADNTEKGNCMFVYGTHHVLVLADFPPSTRTTDLEKLLGKFKDQFVIRWVNDTVSLAVFKTPSVALEAHNSIQCLYTVRILSASDELLSSVPPKDLEPPRQRPETSARTAQRMIAQGMGIKLPSKFGSTELRKQEEARKYRIHSRQSMRDDAWGADEN